MKKRVLSLLLTLTMLLSLVPAMGITASAGTGVSYIDADGEEQTCTDYTVVNNTMTGTWNAGWYVVNSEVSMTGAAVTVSGAVNLILCDGATLTVTGSTNGAGICVSGEGNSLTIYGQTGGTGTLKATGTDGGAGIGGNRGENGSNITINGGTVTATGSTFSAKGGSAGIGGGSNANLQSNGGSCSNIRINGGTVNAIGGDYCCMGIGAGGRSPDHLGTSSNVFVDTSLVIKADNNNPPTTEITNTGSDLASSLADKKFVSIEKPWYTSGDGTAATPYIISDYDGLEAFAAYVNDDANKELNMQGKFIKLADNFGKGEGTAEALTTPIGYNNFHYFNGTFDGNGQTVALAIDTTLQMVGLFGHVSDGTVKNVTTTGSIICANTLNKYPLVGGVVGNNKGIVSNCYATVNISGSGDKVGGVVGTNNNGSLANCYAAGNVSSTGNNSHVGGVAGDNSGSVINCYATGTVTGITAGGVVGNNKGSPEGGSSVINCYATGTVTGTTAGGVVGNNGDMPFSGTITNCYYITPPVGVTYSCQDGIALTADQMKAAETSEDSLVYKLNNYLTTTSTPGAKLWKVEDGVNGGYPTFTDVNYLDASGSTKTCTDYTVVASSTEDVTWSAGWYVVAGSDVQIRNTVTASGDVKLILCDDAKLTVSSAENNGISYQSAGTLTVYGQSTGGDTGKLVATGAESHGGIFAADLEINGGSVTAESSGYTFGLCIDNCTVNGGSLIVNTATASSAIGCNGTFKVNSDLIVKADNTNPPTTEITHTSEQDIATDLNSKKHVLIEKAVPVASIDFGGAVGEKEYATVKDAITAAVDGVSAAANARTVKLISDAKENITIDSGKYVILDLNDHVLKGDGTQSVIINEGTLTVTDSATSKTTKYFNKDGTTGLWTLKSTGTSDNTVTGGVITGGKCQNAQTGVIWGGGINNKGTLTLEKGNIVGNHATYGGGVALMENSTFAMSGGTIVGNYVSTAEAGKTADGAGVFIRADSSFTMKNGAKIAYNTAATGAGGVYVAGRFTMDGGEISDNKATGKSGAGVYVYYKDSTHPGVFTMNGGSIKNNTAEYMGGGVYVDDHATVVIGGTVTGNTSKNFGGGIFTKSNTTIKGAASIKDNTAGTTSKVSGDLAVVKNHSITLDNFSGDNIGVSVIAKNTSKEGNPYEITTGGITTNGTSADVSKFTSDSLAYKVKFIEASGEGESAVAAHLELAKIPIATVTSATVSITLEKSDMTEEQAVAVVEAANVDHSAYVIFGEASQSTKYLFLMYSTDETKWMSATPNGNTLSELKQNELENLYVIGEITEKDPDYLTLTAEEANSTVKFQWISADTDSVMIKPSSTNVLINGTNATSTDWQAYNKNDVIFFPNVNDSVQFKGKNVVTNQYYHFTMSGKISASGSVTSLTDGNGGDAKVTLTEDCYLAMFYGCTALTAAPKLPATKLAVNCYNSMFSGCTALETAPELPATELTENCYNYMFNGCTALKTAPQLPATTLAKACYLGLFKGCILLTAAPELKATALMESCYESMFDGCKALKTAPELPATELIKNCYYYMFSGCTALETAPELKATELADYCYNSMFKGCSKLTVVAVAAETDATWSIPYSSANYPVSNMATNTAVGSVTVETAKNSGEYNYYKVNSKEILTVTATADNMTYTGNAYDNSNVTVSAAKSGGDAVTGLTYTYTWFAANNSTSPLAGAPTDIGAYKLVVSIADSDETYTGKSEAIAINILPAPVDDAHKVVGGTSTYKIGSGEEIKFISIADNTDFVKVTVSKDGGEAEQLTENEHYTRTSGSIKIALTETYIATLTPGKYVFMVHSKLPYATTETVVSAEFVVNVSRSTEFTASTYTVTVANAANGTVVSSAKAAASGSTVTLTVTPDKGYTLETLTVKDAKGNEIELTAKKLGETYTFKMPSSKVTVTATFMEDNTMLNFFVDVKASDYFYDAVLWAATNGITSGVDNLHFAPNAITTRGQMVTFLWRAAGSPEPTATSSTFTDVVAGSYYEKAVLWAVEKGITKGMSETAFAPNATVTRGQCVTFLYRYEGSPAASTSNSFTDVKATDYYNNAVAWAATNKITTGATATTFDPNSNCTRGQIVTFLYRDIVK